MISAQIDELRELAGDGSMEWVAGPISASVLREAADTIWQLRDDLQRANAENAKLRTQLADVTESMGRVEERCARMRKACAELAEFLTEAEWLQWPELRAELRELGVEAEE